MPSRQRSEQEKPRERGLSMTYRQRVNPDSVTEVTNMQDKIEPHMEVIGADGVHIGTVDRIEGNRIRLEKRDSGDGRHAGHHHYIELGFVAGVEGQKVRLSANADIAVTLEEERSGRPV
jgi:hypothetical protein